MNAQEDVDAGSWRASPFGFGFLGQGGQGLGQAQIRPAILGDSQGRPVLLIGQQMQIVGGAQKFVGRVERIAAAQRPFRADAVAELQAHCGQFPAIAGIFGIEGDQLFQQRRPAADFGGRGA